MLATNSNSDNRKYEYPEMEARTTVIAAQEAVSELILIAPTDVADLARQVLGEISHYDANKHSTGALISAMRADLGEPVSESRQNGS
jgi:hypothetical protein